MKKGKGICSATDGRARIAAYFLEALIACFQYCPVYKSY